MKKLSIFAILISGLVITGCGKKVVPVNVTLPPEVPSLNKTKNIAVLPFKNDNVDFTNILQTKLASVKINNKNYFNVIDRNRIQDILKELKFQSSDLVGKKVAKFGKLVGAKVIITGNINSSAKNGSYTMPVQVCASYDRKGHCYYYRTVYKTCVTSNATLNVNINAIKVDTSEIVDGVDIVKNYSADSCKDYGKIMEANAALHKLAEIAAQEYVNRIAPHKVRINVVLLDKVKSIDLNDKEENIFNNAITYIEHGRIKKANELLKLLNKELNGRSYEVLYDIGVTEETLGNYKAAKAAYEAADKVISENGLEPSKEVDTAIERINLIIKKQEQLKKLKKELKLKK